MSQPPASSSSQSRSSGRGYFAKSSLGANCRRFTKTLAATVPPRARAILTRERWPSCRLPMVGTRVTSRRTASARRKSAIVLATCTRELEAVDLVVRKAARFDGRHVASNRLLDPRGVLHEIAHEPEGLSGRHAQHVVQDEHLAAATRTGSDADGGYGERAGEIARKQRRNHFEHEERCAGRGELLGM